MYSRTKLVAMGALALLVLLGIAWRQFADPPAPPAPDRPSETEARLADRTPGPLSGLDGAGVAGNPPRSAGPGPGSAARADPSPPGEAGAGAEDGGGGNGEGPGETGVRTDRAGEVRGRVVADGTDLPVEGVRIVLEYDYIRSGGKWPEGGIREFELRTDENGEFRYLDLPPGFYRIRVEHDDYAPRTLSGVELAKGAGLEGITVGLISDLRKLGSVEGRVLDLFGSPEMGVRVVVHSAGAGGKSSALTDESGVYRVDRLLPGFYIVSLTGSDQAEGPRRLWRRSLSARVLAGQTTQMDFEGSGTLSGVVLDADGRPIKDCLVSLSPVERTEKTAFRRTNPAEDGRFELTNAGVGLFRLTVGGTSAGWFSVEAMTLDLVGSDQEVDIRLEGGGITGRMLLPDGKAPHSRGLYPNIMLYPAVWTGQPGDYRQLATAMPDLQGVFRFRGLAAGKYRLKIHQSGYVCPERDVAVARGEVAKDVSLTLHPLVVGTLEVTVVDRDGNPVEGVVLNYGIPGKPVRGVRVDYSGPGRYLSHLVEAGSWTLTINCPGMKPGRVPFEVRAGQTTKLEVTLELE